MSYAAIYSQSDDLNRIAYSTCPYDCGRPFAYISTHRWYGRTTNIYAYSEFKTLRAAYLAKHLGRRYRCFSDWTIEHNPKEYTEQYSIANPKATKYFLNTIGAFNRGNFDLEVDPTHPLGSPVTEKEEKRAKEADGDSVHLWSALPCDVPYIPITTASVEYRFENAFDYDMVVIYEDGSVVVVPTTTDTGNLWDIRYQKDVTGITGSDQWKELERQSTFRGMKSSGYGDEPFFRIFKISSNNTKGMTYDIILQNTLPHRRESVHSVMRKKFPLTDEIAQLYTRDRNKNLIFDYAITDDYRDYTGRRWHTKYHDIADHVTSQTFIPVSSFAANSDKSYICEKTRMIIVPKTAFDADPDKYRAKVANFPNSRSVSDRITDLIADMSDDRNVGMVPFIFTGSHKIRDRANTLHLATRHGVMKLRCVFSSSLKEKEHKLCVYFPGIIPKVCHMDDNNGHVDMNKVLGINDNHVDWSDTLEFEIEGDLDEFFNNPAHVIPITSSIFNKAKLCISADIALSASNLLRSELCNELTETVVNTTTQNIKLKQVEVASVVAGTEEIKAKAAQSVVVVAAETEKMKAETAQSIATVENAHVGMKEQTAQIKAEADFKSQCVKLEKAHVEEMSNAMKVALTVTPVVASIVAIVVAAMAKSSKAAPLMTVGGGVATAGVLSTIGAGIASIGSGLLSIGAGVMKFLPWLALF